VDAYEGGIAGEMEQERREQDEEEKAAADKPEGWGREFKIEWIRTERLPFSRTRHLRNPWNHDREIKVSRDGTELEPTVGQRLLEEWNKPDPSPPSPPPIAAPSPPTSPVRGPQGGRTTRSAARAAANLVSSQSMPSFSSQMARTGGPPGRHGGRSDAS